MEIIWSVVTGVLVAAAVYMMMRRNIVKMMFGIMLLSHAANLLIFTMGGLTRDRTAIIPHDATRLEGPFADPVPQALILTAIVIGFGVQAFALLLFWRGYISVDSDDLDAMKATDAIDEKTPEESE